MRRITLLFVVLFASSSALAGSIALSFDDAPIPGSKLMSGTEKTERIIKGLKAQGVEDAIFFATAKHLDSDSIGRLKRYAKVGFHLANHSHSHQSANKIPAQEFLLDFYKAHLILKDLDNYTKLYRFPYLHHGDSSEVRQAIYAGLQEIDYDIGYVTIDNFDWYLNGKLLDAVDHGKKIHYERLKKLYVDTLWEGIVFYDNIAKKTLGRSPKHVLLLHENELAALFIDDLIEKVRQQGWEFISPLDAYKDPIAKQYNSQFEFTKQGRVAAIAHASGMDASKLRHESENTEYLDRKLKEYKVFE